MNQKCTVYASLSCLQERLPRNGVIIFFLLAVLMHASMKWDQNPEWAQAILPREYPGKRFSVTAPIL